MIPLEKVPLITLPSPEERRKLRIRMGLSYKEAATEIGVTPRTLWRWEHGEKPSPRKHRQYQQVLGRWKEVIENFS